MTDKENKIRKEVKKLIKEELTKNELQEIRDIIRMEIADVFFTLFRKRNVWMK